MGYRPIFCTRGKSLIRQELITLLEPTVNGMGYELIDIDLELGGRGLVRLFIDGPDGVGLDDCSKVSSQVSALLDVEDPIPGHYVLEVSSPGLNRILRTAEHFRQFTGKRVKVRMERAVDGRKRFIGQLLGLDEEQVLVEMADQEYRLPIEDIKRARLAPEL